ncbi:MAG: hypothetical protein P9M03_06735 [Candidatus Theseobacter exili]|nr:hypothetical protein [Candidatus Theseobacter exili]
MKNRIYRYGLILSLLFICSGFNTMKAITSPIETLKECVVKDLAEDLRKSMKIMLVLMALCVSFFTLLGNKIIESTRSKIVKNFKIPLNSQVALVVFLYLFSGYICFIISLCLPGSTLPFLILASSSIYPFFGEYIPALKKDDASGRKIAMSKLKTLGLFSVVILAVFFVLTDSWIEKIVN